MNIETVVVLTGSGGAARMMSEYRPRGGILALTTDDVTYRRLALYWGVIPILTPPIATLDEFVERAQSEILARNLSRPGDHVILTAGVPIGSGMTTNMMQIHRIG